MMFRQAKYVRRISYPINNQFINFIAQASNILGKYFEFSFIASLFDLGVTIKNHLILQLELFLASLT